MAGVETPTVHPWRCLAVTLIAMDSIAAARVLVVGSGKLARELLEDLNSPAIAEVVAWEDRDSLDSHAEIVIHAGSGREVEAVVAYCARSGSILIELATGSALEAMTVTFPVVICPNVNLLMLKFMAMLETFGPLFCEYDRTLVESHQAAKTSAPGTAYQLADALELDRGAVRSIRDPKVQERELGIPAEHLARHAFHRISIHDGNAQVVVETTVLGEAPYARGLACILEGMSGRVLEPRVHQVVELVRAGWI